jgi:hypothetical protein
VTYHEIHGIGDKIEEAALSLVFAFDDAEDNDSPNVLLLRSEGENNSGFSVATVKGERGQDCSVVAVKFHGSYERHNFAQAIIILAENLKGRGFSAKPLHEGRIV